MPPKKKISTTSSSDGEKRAVARPQRYFTLAPTTLEAHSSYVPAKERAILGAQPFVKWAGGKRQLLPWLTRLMPTVFANYFEPFAGGAALFFHLQSRGFAAKSNLADQNPDLITAYLAVQQTLPELAKRLGVLEEGHRIRGEDHYYEVRAQSPVEPIEIAARLIYLNRTCFNGLWRVNAKGRFNVPIGRYSNPQILNLPGLQAASSALRRTTILLEDFEAVALKASKGDFIYFDPPYVPLTATASFTGYTRDSFRLEDQGRLARLFKLLTERGCYVMLSNSGTDVVGKLYEPIASHIVCVPARRAISSRVSTRVSVKEFVVLNYSPPAELHPMAL